MEPKVLGKITGALNQPRGPDVELRFQVPAEWIEVGATLSIELPRNLACAACGGGGCDACDRAGAVSVRGRKEPADVVEVTLPRGAAVGSTDHALVLRVPERGGLPREGSGLPRGHLLLSIRRGAEPPSGITRLARPSVPPPPAPQIVSGATGATRLATSRSAWIAAAVLAAIVLAGLAWVLR